MSSRRERRHFRAEAAKSLLTFLCEPTDPALNQEPLLRAAANNWLDALQVIRPLAPPPPSPEMAQSAKYRSLSAAAKAMLMLCEIEIADQGGTAVLDCADICHATGADRWALIAALDRLAAAGFVVVSMNGTRCTVAPSTEWRA